MYVSVKYQNTYTMHQSLNPKFVCLIENIFLESTNIATLKIKPQMLLLILVCRFFATLNLNLLENFVVVDGCHDVLNLGGNNVVAEDCLLAAVKQLPGSNITQL